MTAWTSININAITSVVELILLPLLDVTMDNTILDLSAGEVHQQMEVMFANKSAVMESIQQKSE